MDTAAASREFNSRIKYLARIYVSKKRGLFDEESATRTVKRLSLLISSDPIYLIEACGPILLRYGTQIQEHKWGELMDMDFSAEKKIYETHEDSANCSDNEIDNEITFIKNVYKLCEGEERVVIEDCVTSMLSAYCSYALAVRNN